MKNTLYVTESDFIRIRNILVGMKQFSQRDTINAKKLHQALLDAVILPAGEIPGTVVTMNSRVTVRDPITGECSEFTLVFPEKSDYRRGCISVLAPLGSALIGSRVGDIVQWEVPRGERRLEIQEIRYQPEASGDLNI